MDELHSYRSFAHSRGYALDRTMPHIAHCKDPGNICFQQEGIPVERPTLGVLSVANKIGASQQETAFVALDQISEPVGAREGSDEDEHRTRRDSLQLVGIRTKDRDLFQMDVTVRLGHAGVGPYLNVGCLFNLCLLYTSRCV